MDYKNKLCVMCGQLNSCMYFNDDCDYLIINTIFKEYIFCCDCSHKISSNYANNIEINWENIINGANHNMADNFGNWIKLSIKCGYIIPKAERASIIIQRTFRKYINRKKNLRNLFLISNYLSKNNELPYLPPEMYMMISKFI